MQLNKCHSIRGLTLVELLVVISVIAVLVAMLLPAMGKARDQAMLVKCSTQTRAISQGTANYAADFQNNLPPNFNITPTTGNLTQGSKDPGGYWWYSIGGGLQRAGLLWPYYINNSETFYCPSTTGYSDNPGWQNYHHNWTAEQVGKATGPIAAVVSYAYPAVKYEVCKVNAGGDWTGIPGQYWSSGGAYDAYTYWSEDMLEQRLDANRPATPVSWDLNGQLTMHGGAAATISFVDGSAIQFQKVQYLQQTLTWVFGNGMGHPSILPTLRKYREEGTLP